MKEKTAVEWLIEQIYYTDVKITRGLLKQAKEMEKQQIKDAFEQGDYTGRGFEDITSEEYYNINFLNKSK
jgi:hypothetical protein